MAQRMIRRLNDNKMTTDERAVDFMESVQKAIDYKELSSAVCFVKHKSGEISAITTDGDAAEIIGVIEVGKNLIYEDRFHNND